MLLDAPGRSEAELVKRLALSIGIVGSVSLAVLAVGLGIRWFMDMMTEPHFVNLICGCATILMILLATVLVYSFLPIQEKRKRKNDEL